MTVKKIFFLAILAGLFLSSCNNSTQTKPVTTTTTNDTTTESKLKNMNSYISMFEIPATDISRAVSFYQTILDLKIEKMDVEGMKMGIFPFENQMVTVTIIEADGYKPSADGVTIYLNGGDNLQVILDKVEKNGGKIITPKTAHADESGFFAIFIDTEGNKVGLNSPK